MSQPTALVAPVTSTVIRITYTDGGYAIVTGQPAQVASFVRMINRHAAHNGQEVSHVVDSHSGRTLYINVGFAGSI